MRSLPRDIDALLDYTRQLELIRESQLERGIEGVPMTPEEIAQSEAAALERMKRLWFNPAMRRVARGDEGALMTEEQDFAQRAFKLADEMTLAAHRTLVAMPFVGQPQFQDSSPPRPALARLPR